MMYFFVLLLAYSLLNYKLAACNATFFVEKGANKMDTKMRYHVLPDSNHSGILIFDAETKVIQHPVCWQDLVAYYNYLVGLGRIEESQKLLADSMAGKKPITKMVEYLSNQF
jgi:hypothetical protein